MKISPALMVAIVAAVGVYFYIRKTKAAPVAPPSLQPGGVPQGWIEQTPAGHTVVGTTTDLYDIAT